jgi:hypothetical protein
VLILIKKILAVLLVLSLLPVSGTGCRSDFLAPHEVSESLLEQVVKVRGKIDYAIENPMGLGGMYMKLKDAKGEVDVRIQPEIWDAYGENEKSLYRDGRTVTVEGILFRAGSVLVVVHEKYELTRGASENLTSSTY